MKIFIKKLVKLFHLPMFWLDEIFTPSTASPTVNVAKVWFWLDEIFTPSTAATINYIERHDIDRKLISEMETPGKQLIVYGHSGSGKTSSVRNMLNKKK